MKVGRGRQGFYNAGDFELLGPFESERERPAYRVGDLQVQGLANGRRRNNANTQMQDVLTVQLDVFGFRRVE